MIILYGKIARLSQTVRDEESPSIARQGAG